MAGLYIHIPYCRRACAYCDFHFSTQRSHVAEMVEALCAEMVLRRRALGRLRVSTFYLGGGTPSLLDGVLLEKLIRTAHKIWNLRTLRECTMEVNPEDVRSVDQLKAWRSWGIDRISLGVQSFDQGCLDTLGRVASVAQNQAACERVMEAGFKRHSLDLIYGRGQWKAVQAGPKLKKEAKEAARAHRRQAWRKDIEMAFSYGMGHLSAYALSLEPRTALHHAYVKGAYQPLATDEVATDWFDLCRYAQKKGYYAYEVSSFAKKGHEAIHNRNYWRGVKYVGIGPGAHSYDGNKRWYALRQNASYIKSLALWQLPPQQEELLSREGKLREHLLLRMRTAAGLRWTALDKSQQHALQETKQQLQAAGLLRKQAAYLRPTAQGMLLADTVVEKLLAALDK